MDGWIEVGLRKISSMKTMPYSNTYLGINVRRHLSSVIVIQGNHLLHAAILIDITPSVTFVISLRKNIVKDLIAIIVLALYKSII